MRLKEEERAFQMSDIHFKLRKSGRRVYSVAATSSKGWALMKDFELDGKLESARALYQKAHELGLRISFASRELMDEIASVTL